MHAVTAAPALRPHTAGATLASGSHTDPRNFLLAGGSGARALDGQRAKAQAAAAHTAVHDLRGNNAALAAELARVQAEREREADALRGELLSLAGRFKAEQVGGALKRASCLCHTRSMCMRAQPMCTCPRAASMPAACCCPSPLELADTHVTLRHTHDVVPPGAAAGPAGAAGRGVPGAGGAGGGTPGGCRGRPSPFSSRVLQGSMLQMLLGQPAQHTCPPCKAR